MGIYGERSALDKKGTGPSFLFRIAFGGSLDPANQRLNGTPFYIIMHVCMMLIGFKSE